MDRNALNWEDLALKESIKLRSLLRELDGKKATVKEARQRNYNVIEALNKSCRTEETIDEDDN